jgi:pyridinium-3,5-bisthiocarboxylic acid mononucleotide nickel chelatase
MRIGFIECFAGISGDMLLGALIDAGVTEATLQEATAALGVGATLRISRVDRSGIMSAKVDVLVDGHPAEKAGKHSHEDAADHSAHAHPHTLDHPHEHNAPSHSHEAAAKHSHPHVHGRNLAEILAIIDSAKIAAAAKQLASDAFRLLAAAEAKIHGVAESEIHFHEVGAVDAIVDIVCNAVGLVELGAERWVCSPLNVGTGFVDCAHGRFPVPAPATAELLKGAPTYSSGIAMELVTPTGAALIKALGCEFAEQPRMITRAIGYGAGNRNPEKFPNVVRISIGDGVAETKAKHEVVSVIECAIDDQSPQVLAHCMQLALERGALDVMSSPVTMKKGRLGTLLTLLVSPERTEEFGKLLLRETTTLGYRVREEVRACLDREWSEVVTQYGRVRIKIASLGGVEYNFAPEYEDCRLLAEEQGVPVKLVMLAALAAATAERVSAKVSR